MDIDGDKIDDLIAGSYTGGVAMFPGLAGGKFGPRRQLRPVNVNYDMAELANSPCAGDWDGDGDYDIVVGAIAGPVRLFLNDGKGNFSKGEDLTVNGKPIEAADGGPCVVDWNGDGVLDLLLGDDLGGVAFYPGRTRGSLELGAAEAVIAAKSSEEAWKVVNRDPASPTGLTIRQPGLRVKPFAADWNGDGKLDMLVGDFVQVSPEARTLTGEETKRLAELDKEMAEVDERVSLFLGELGNKAAKAAGIEPGQAIPADKLQAYQDAWQAGYEARSDAIKRDEERQRKLYAEIGQLRPQPVTTGFVWVYLRK